MTIVIPVLLFGPWLPLIDLVAFVGMDSYPPRLSYGPFHYSVFQFTYFGHYLISRLLVDIGLPIRFEIPFFYLLQAGICFAVVWRILERMVGDSWLCAVGVAIGVLAYWDGVFLWGGPLAYSLAAAFTTVATFLVFRGCAEPEKDAELPIALALGFALLCHPVAVPFALVLCGLRWLFNRRRRWQTVAFACGVMVYAWVILRDSPAAEANASGGLRLLFGFDLHQMHDRIVGLFVQDGIFVRTLFGKVPVSSRIFFAALAVIHVFGFLASPWFAWRAKENIWLRMVAALNTVAAILYLFAFDLPTGPIPEWPQRILTLYAPFTFLAGFGAIVRIFGARCGALTRHVSPRLLWAAPWCILVFAGWTQARVFQFSRRLETAIDEARRDVVASGVKGAYVVVSGVDSLHPFFLRCVPFVLFSDPTIIAQHLLIGTEWHFQARHPTRIAEASLESGRRRFLAEFSSANSHVSVTLIPQPEDRFPTIEGTNIFRWGNPIDLANDERALAIELFENGAYVDAAKHFNTAVHLLPKDPSPWIDSGVAFFNAGMLNEAADHFQRALQLAPNSADAHADYAAVLIDVGKIAEAEAQVQRALQLDPRNGRANQLKEKLSAQPPGAIGIPPVRK